MSVNTYFWGFLNFLKFCELFIEIFIIKFLPKVANFIISGMLIM